MEGEEDESMWAGLSEEEQEEREEVWFDWSFVEFWKNNYCGSLFPFQVEGGTSSRWLTRMRSLLADTIQRSINADPELSTRPADADSESAHLITSLRTRVKSQSEELEDLQAKLASMKNETETKFATLQKETDAKFEAAREENEKKYEKLRKEQEVATKEHEEEVSLGRVLFSFRSRRTD